MSSGILFHIPVGDVTYHLMPVDWMADTLRGRKGLRTAKPNKGDEPGLSLAKFVWRWCRFNSGADVTMPVMAEFDLMNFCEGYLGVPKISCFDVSFTGLSKELNKPGGYIDQVCDALSISKMAGAARWGRAFGIL